MPPNPEQPPPPAEQSQRRVPEAEYTRVFNDFIELKPGLKTFYNTQALEDIVKAAKVMGDKLMDQGCSGEYAVPLSLLTLYDIAMLVDDSSSMNYEQEGARKETLKQTLEEVTKIYDLANETGLLAVRFINNTKGRKNVVNSKVNSIFDGRKYNGVTMIGTALEKRMLQPFVKKKEKMKKPLLVMTITDGKVEGEKTGLLKRVIIECIDFLKAEPERVVEAVAFHFCRVGDDEDATEMLEHLDNCIEVGEYVDCLPVDKPLENLSDSALKWHILTKLLIGAIDAKIDKMELDLNEGDDELKPGKAEPIEEEFEDDE